MRFATKSVHEWERQYIDDCLVNKDPHGYYGAFLQPCEFTFRKSSWSSSSSEDLNILHDDGDTEKDDVDKSRGDNADGTHITAKTTSAASRDNGTAKKPHATVPDAACSDKFSTIMSQPMPFHWIFNMSGHFQVGSSSSDDWDSMSSDDFDDIATNLMLWPDQCVGVSPRCYNVNDDPMIQDQLAQFFILDGGIPPDATHVQVNCQADAMELSRVMYAAADGFERSMPAIMAWMVTIVLLVMVTSLWCCFGCCRLVTVFCTPRGSTRNAMTYDHLNSKYVEEHQYSNEREYLLKKK